MAKEFEENIFFLFKKCAKMLFFQIKCIIFASRF